ncbi:MAG: DNA-binding protein [Proteobacteria bacterium]|nr:DNA-binding protein [Pseudomonadota bacterium]
MNEGIPEGDILRGAKAIAAFINTTERRAFYKCERGHIPAFKEGRIWCLRKSRYLRDIEAKEAAA